MPRLQPRPVLRLTSARTCLVTVGIEWFPGEREGGEGWRLDATFYGNDRGEALRGGDDALYVAALVFRNNGLPTQVVRFLIDFVHPAFDEDDPIPVPFPFSGAWSERDEIYTVVRLVPPENNDRLVARSNTVSGFFGS
jgi:hypothetical protein